mgnify:FL=1|tara:strand:- start:765 stop:1166 length:402 start_codon:yes stop_codon:yes gene_type:complete
MDYNSSTFRNGAIDRLKGKFGKGQTEKPVTVRPSSEQVSRVKGRMESDINKMDAEIKGYEYTTPKSKTGLACSLRNEGLCKDSKEAYREVVTEDAMKGNKDIFVGKNIQSTRSAYQGAKKAHSYAKSQYEKYL